jgi:signal peptidase I
MEQVRRATAARLGVVALNLLTPGLGLLRVGRGRAGFIWIGLILVALLGMIAFYALTPELGFVGYVILFAAVLVGGVTSFVATIAQTWRASAVKVEPRARWTRWYALFGVWLLATLLGQGLVEIAHRRYYKPFYAPGEAMTPTIALNDRFLVKMRPTGPFRRGDVIVFEANGQMRIDRILGLPGDRVAMRRGVPSINGQPVLHRALGDFRYDGMDGPAQARRLEEQFPGEARPHFILDFGYAPELDELPEVTVPSGRLFVLGDNRDRAADSRVPPYMNGVGLPELGEVRGRPLFFYWSSDRGKIGTRINP